MREASEAASQALIRSCPYYERTFVHSFDGKEVAECSWSSARWNRNMTPSSGSFETVIQSVRWPKPKSIICGKATRGGIERA